MPIIPLDPKTTLHNKRYLIIKILGYGGFGNTYLAFDQTLNNHCVVKEFALDMICTRDSTNATISILHKREGEMAKWLDKFTEEARNLSLIRHIGVVNAFDIWWEKGTAFYAMEYIEGGELQDPAKNTWTPIAWTEAKRLAIAILEALKAVHEAGLLHGDIKPANILIDKKTRQPILIDFGTARSLKKAQDKTATSLAYTVGYAPIELQDRSRSKEANSSSDLYSWAMVVIGLVKKHHDKGFPIDAKTRIMLNKGNLDEYNEEFLKKWLANSLPNSVISILASCLRLNSKQRPQSASIVLKQLKNSEQNLPKQDPFYSQNQSNLNSIFEQDNNKTLLERNDENIHLKQNESDSRAEKPKVRNSKTNKITIFALVIGIVVMVVIVGIGLFFVETVPPPEGFVLIPAGSFLMGSPSSELGRDRDERQHEVDITHSFYMQTHEVTQGEWQALMGNNPSHFSSCGSDCPVENVTWYEALAYANALSDSEGLQECYVLLNCLGRPGNQMECEDVSLNSDCGYRLPTEAEWEYAAKAGSRTAFYNGEQMPDDIAWYDANSNRRTHPVGEKAPNSWGLYDMSGNVWEWCWDRYEERDRYEEGDRIGRGGSWLESAENVRSSLRGGGRPYDYDFNIGFRLVRSVP